MLRARRSIPRMGFRFSTQLAPPSVIFRNSETNKGRPLDCVISEYVAKQGLFVDQTNYVEKLFTDSYTKVQAAVPRRFSKTTYLRLIEDMCRENAKAIFNGTHLGRSAFFQKEWQAPYPVLKFDFSKLTDPNELKKRLLKQVTEFCRKFDFTTSDDDFADERLESLLNHLKRKGKRAVVLVDEYDVPIHGATPENLDILHKFFATLKDNSLITKLVVFGTHKKLSLIGTSTNDTPDLIQTPPFYNMFGWTEAHLREIFSTEDPSYTQFKPKNFQATVKLEENPEEFSKQKLDWIMNELNTHYDGYRFSGLDDAAKLYNPYSVLMFRQQSGVVRVYSEIITRTVPGIDDILTKYPNLLETTVECGQFGTTKIDKEPVSEEDAESIKLLWELGALTVEKVNFMTDVTTLKGTNNEMKKSFEGLALDSFKKRNKDIFAHFKEAAAEFHMNEMSADFAKILRSRKNSIYAEIYMQSAFYEGFFGVKLDARMEFYTKEGNWIDLIVLGFPEYVYVFELKFKSTVEAALEQLKEKRYCYGPLTDPKMEGKAVVGVAMNFTPKKGLSIIYVTATLLGSGPEIVYTQMSKFEDKYGNLA